VQNLRQNLQTSETPLSHATAAVDDLSEDEGLDGDLSDGEEPHDFTENAPLPDSGTDQPPSGPATPIPSKPREPQRASISSLLKSSNSFKEKSSQRPSQRQKDHRSKKTKNAALEQAALKIQSHVRRWRTVRLVRAFRERAIASSTIIQTIVRGFCSRIRVKRALLAKRSSIKIQKRARGMISRVRVPSASFSPSDADSLTEHDQRHEDDCEAV
jgi:hypothetical protein